MHVIVAAEPIENGAGLATFVLDAVGSFAPARPDWRFTVLASKAFGDAAALRAHPNVDVVIYDDLGLRRRANALLPGMRGRDQALDLLARLAPGAALRRSLGNLAETWRALPPYDAVWVPHFAISRDIWPALYHPGTVRAPVLLTIHDLHTAVFPEEWRRYPAMVDNFWNVFRPFTHRVATVIADSEYQKQLVVSHFGLSPDSVRVVYLPPPDLGLIGEWDDKKNEEPSERYGIADRYVLCPLSQLSRHKNHVGIISAWSMLHGRMGGDTPQLVFTATGDRDQMAVLAKAIAMMGLAKKVAFTGLVGRAELGRLYRGSLAVAFPSRYEAGSGYPVLEAALLGKKIFCSRIPPIVEQVDKFGLKVRFFDPDDPDSIATTVQQGLRDEAMLIDGERFREKAASLRLRFASAYLDAFESLPAKA